MPIKSFREHPQAKVFLDLDWRIILKVSERNKILECFVNSRGSELDPISCSCNQGNKYSNSIKGGHFLNQQIDRHLHKNKFNTRILFWFSLAERLKLAFCRSTGQRTYTKWNTFLQSNSFWLQYSLINYRHSLFYSFWCILAFLILLEGFIILAE